MPPSLTNVAVLVYDGVAPFELGVVCEAWGIDRRDDGLPMIDFAVCGPHRGSFETSAGFAVQVDHDLSRAAHADLVVVPALPRDGVSPPGVIDALQDAYHRGATVMSICSGAFVLGEAGLLDDRDCTTHWRYAQELQERFPRARVDADVLYVDTGPVVTGAGSAAGLDASLHLWRKHHGSVAAGMVARRMVVPPQRDGGQAQFIRSAVPQCAEESLEPLLRWVAENLRAPLDVESLARRAAMSPRTFARRFRAEVGTTPHAWVTAQRLRAAEELLEHTGRPVEWIAHEVGLANAATLRHQFTRVRGVSPQQYRRAFRVGPDDESGRVG